MSINERKHPGIRETPMDFLSSYEKRKFEKFRELLSPEHDSITDFTLYRFLKQNTFYTTPAEKQFLAYMQWREDKHLNTLPLPVPRKYAVQGNITPHAYHGFDKEGRPLYIEKTGKIDCSRLVDESVMTTEEFLDGHVWGIEKLHTLCFEQSKVLGKRVETFTSIIDMEGLSLNHRNALPRLNQAMSLDSQYYPYFIGKLYILHTPFLAPLVYSAVSPFVPKEVRDRMYVLKNNDALREYIDVSELPVELGGTCRLHGGVLCIRTDGYDPAMSPRHGGDQQALDELHPVQEVQQVHQVQQVQQAQLVQVTGEEQVPTLALKRDSFQYGAMKQELDHTESSDDFETAKQMSERQQRAHRSVV